MGVSLDGGGEALAHRLELIALLHKYLPRFGILVTTYYHLVTLFLPQDLEYLPLHLDTRFSPLCYKIGHGAKIYIELEQDGTYYGCTTAITTITIKWINEILLLMMTIT